MGDYIIKSKPRFREWRLFGRHIYLVHEDGLIGNVIFFDSDQIGVSASVTCQPSKRAGIVNALRILADQIEETIT